MQQGGVLTFYILAILILAPAIAVVRVRNIFHAGVFLALSFLGVAGLYFLLGAEFIAGIQVLIYVGAVIVLLLFATMMTQRIASPLAPVANRLQLGALLSILVLLIFLVVVIWGSPWIARFGGFGRFSASDLGKSLLSTYLLPFELVSVLLLAVLLGSIVIARRDK